MLLPLVALDFFEIVFCPAERIVVLAVGKVGISEAVSVEFRKRNTLAPPAGSASSISRATKANILSSKPLAPLSISLLIACSVAICKGS